MTDALAMQRPQRWDVPFSRDLPDARERRSMRHRDVDRILAMEPFCRLDPGKFREPQSLAAILRNDARIRRYRRGDIVVRQGDYGNSAFWIMAGGVRVFLPASASRPGLDPKLLGRRERRRRSWLRELLQPLTNPRSPEVRDPRQYVHWDLSDEPSATSAEDPVFVTAADNLLERAPDVFDRVPSQTLARGELFGELAAIGRTPRAATVVADPDVELLEIRWQGLRELMNHGAELRDFVDERFRRYALGDALQTTLPHLTKEQAELVAAAAVFESYGRHEWYAAFQTMRRKDADPIAREQIIAEEGHYPNGMIVIRSGFARISRRHGSGEQTVGFLGKGDVFGLAELAGSAGGDAVAFQSTLRAIGYVDVVRIPTRVVEQAVLPGLSRDRLEELVRRAGRRDGEQTVDPGMMESLVQHRFINGTAAMVIDMNRCTRCDDCVRACADGHDNNPVFIRHGPILDRWMVANACMHCVDPVCMIPCPTGAIHRDADTGEIVVNDLTCIGCSACAASCPYDNIRMVETRDARQDDGLLMAPDGKPILKATKCDLCADHHGGPACERACPHDALKRMDMRDLPELARWMSR